MQQGLVVMRAGHMSVGLRWDVRLACVGMALIERKLAGENFARSTYC